MSTPALSICLLAIHYLHNRPLGFRPSYFASTCASTQKSRGFRILLILLVSHYHSGTRTFFPFIASGCSIALL